MVSGSIRRAPDSEMGGGKSQKKSMEELLSI